MRGRSFILLLLLAISSVRSYSQESFAKELKCFFCDSIVMPVFQDTNQII